MQDPRIHHSKNKIDAYQDNNTIDHIWEVILLVKIGQSGDRREASLVTMNDS